MTDSRAGPDEPPDHVVGRNLFDTQARLNAPSSPILIGVLGAVVVPAEYAITEGAEVLAVLGIVLIQVAALLFAPRTIWHGVEDYEERWKQSSWITRQQRLGERMRRDVSVLARISLYVSLAAPPVFVVAVIVDQEWLRWTGGALMAWAVFVSPLALISSGLLSGRWLPRRLLHVEKEPMTVSRVLEKLYGRDNEPRTMMAALTLFLLGTVLSTMALAPGNAPFG